MDFKPFAGTAQDFSLRPLLRKIASVLGTAKNPVGQLRVSVDNIPAVTLASLATVTTVTTVNTMLALNNVLSIGGYSAAMDQMYAGRSARSGIRSRIT